MGLVEKRSLVEVRSIYPGEFRGCVHFTPENFGAAVVVFSLSLSPHESQITSHPLRPLGEVLFVICHLSFVMRFARLFRPEGDAVGLIPERNPFNHRASSDIDHPRGGST